MAEERLPLFQTRRLKTRHFAAQEIIDKNNAKKEEEKQALSEKCDGIGGPRRGPRYASRMLKSYVGDLYSQQIYDLTWFNYAKQE